MGSNLNFKNFGNEPPSEGGGGSGRPPGSYPLARQSSVYSLTFDEFQNTLGGVGKDFGSMNMDELLKSIWSAEETQSMASAAAAAAAASAAQDQNGGFLQRQGSLTLPRTLSQKTVDEVWRDISMEYGGGAVAAAAAAAVAAATGGKDGAGPGSNIPQRQQTLGEMTLEEFLVRAGVVREDAQVPPPKPYNNSNNTATGFFGDIARATNCSNGFGINFQQPNQGAAAGVMGNGIPENNNRINMQSPNLPLNVNGVRSSQQQPSQAQQPRQQQQPHPQPQIFPKQTPVSFAQSVGIPTSTQLASPRLRGGMVGLTDQINGNLAQNASIQGGAMGMVGMGGGAMHVPNGSPATLSSDGLGRNNGDTSSVSPVPYVYNGGIRGRKSSNSVEKVIERRQRRMIKNRESAARSRARKQAYTMELEQEVAKLKEENQELRKKQEEIMEMQKNQAMEMMNAQSGAKRKCLRRTQTGPW